MSTEPGWRYPPIYAWNARNRAEQATAEARFLAGRARLALSPPGTWQRSPQRGLVRAARNESRDQEEQS